jgi:phenylalanyl-tRNA synthetase beta chain
VIADDAKVLALAGIMGGIESSVTDSTTSVFLESAHFTPNAIAGKARRVGLHTDSSHRFERGVDPALTAQALEYATQLILTIAGGEVGPVCAWQVAVHAASPISFNLNKLSAMLGLSIPKTSAVDILNRLGFAVSEQGENLSVTAPSWRFDISIPEDLIEEVARIYGYDHIPTQLPQAKLQVQAVLESHVSLNKIKQTLVTRGFREAITYSFIDPKWHEQVFPGQPAYALSNPIASDMAVMRTSLLPGLLQALRYNVQRQQTRLRLFETGRCFLLNNNAVQEQEKVAILVYGHVNPEHWSGQRTADFFDVKGDVMALLGLTAQAQDFSFTPEHKISFLHPGQSAAIQLQGQTVGCVGALHPSLIQALDLREQVLLAELDLAILQQAKLPHYHSLSKYPSIRRDLALLVNETIPAEVVCAEIKKTAGNLLQSIQVFDVYQGDKIVPGKKSLALGLVLQDVEKTLTDNEIVAVIDRILSGLQQQLNIQLRE